MRDDSLKILVRETGGQRAIARLALNWQQHEQGAIGAHEIKTWKISYAN
jgi:hypothetical protein